MGLLLALATAAKASAQAPQVPVTVRTSGGDVTIVADQLEQVGPEHMLIATGNVELTKGTTRLMADRIELNRATGDAVAQGRVVFYDGEDQLTGQRIEYNVKTGTGVVYQADASFWVRNIPLIPFVPFFAAAIRSERQTGFLFPKFGQSSSKGFYAELPFFWAIDDSQDLMFSPLAYTRLGEGFNLDYRYLLPNAQHGRAG